jgi:hypothetical protein
MRATLLGSARRVNQGAFVEQLLKPDCLPPVSDTSSALILIERNDRLSISRKGQTIDDGIYSVVNISDGGAASGTLSTAGAITAFSVSSAAVPEPSTWVAMLTGFGILGAVMWKRRPASTDPKTA